jgi:hypothetical protein
VRFFRVEVQVGAGKTLFQTVSATGDAAIPVLAVVGFAMRRHRFRSNGRTPLGVFLSPTGHGTTFALAPLEQPNQHYPKKHAGNGFRRRSSVLEGANLSGAAIEQFNLHLYPKHGCRSATCGLKQS